MQLITKKIMILNLELSFQLVHNCIVCSTGMMWRSILVCVLTITFYMSQYHRPFKQDFRHLKLDVPNLKSLILGGFWVASEPGAVPFFLRHSPMLEMLTLIYSKVLFLSSTTNSYATVPTLTNYLLSNYKCFGLCLNWYLHQPEEA